MAYIELTRGYRAIIDDVDTGFSEQNWSALVTKSGLVYAQRKGKDSEKEDGRPRQTFLLHREIMGATKRSQKVDHINGDTLDNRRENLRICSHADNIRNAKLRQNNSTGFAGVQWSKRIRRFQVFMLINGKNTYFGCFKNVEDAAAKRKALEAEHWDGYYPRRDS